MRAIFNVNRPFCGLQINPSAGIVYSFVRMRKSKYILVIVGVILFSTYLESCNKDGLTHIENTISFYPRLSDYNIFQGNPSDLIPAADFQMYELATPLFTDYAEKQRLIKIPAGLKMSAIDEGLLIFPEGTMIVKTFFYYNDKRDATKGKEMIETRLLIKSGPGWSVATYVWDKNQKEALLLTTGLNTTVNWIDDKGVGHVISYHIPSVNECATCHQSANTIIPIGPKLRNLNRMVYRNYNNINQLLYFYQTGILDSLDPHLYTALPDWQDPDQSQEQRARAYLDVNCAHCHNEKGFASDVGLHLAFEKSLDASNIRNKKTVMLERMKEGTMPKLGTSIVHTEGLELIKAYLNSLN
jgi:uncharacterized repeat protein (TIGR03806 family)